jgi:polysaccharide biosynthesis PFTS motif protein
MPCKVANKKFVFFAGLSQNETQNPINYKNRNIINWYIQWPGRNKEICFIGHNVKNQERYHIQNIEICYYDPLAPLIGIRKNLKLFLWGIGAIVLSFYDWVHGRWWSPLMLWPCSESYLARNQATLAVDYLFNNSVPWKKTWLYETEARGAKSTFYFYSTNCDSIKTSSGYQPTPGGYRKMNWDRYLVWDEEQAEFLVRAGNPEERIQITGPIWFSDGSGEVPSFPANSVAVFDIQPRRTFIYVTYGFPTEYYVPKTCIMFLKDIQETAESLGLPIAWKGKRILSKRNLTQISNSYIKTVKSLCDGKKMFYVRPDISSYHIIEKSSLVVSLPFTSTAIIGRHLGKPSCYYDPLGIIQKNDRAAHGITVVSGLNELKKWMISSTR